MQGISKIPIALVFVLSLTPSFAQKKNLITEKVQIMGNCGICERTIEKAGSEKKIARVDWSIATKMATLIYDSTKTSRSEILQRIALAGYDNEAFVAPDEVYAKLPACCQFERTYKAIAAQDVRSDKPTEMDPNNEIVKKVSPLKAVFESYFLVKDALVSSDRKMTASRAKEALQEMNAVKMEQLGKDERAVWTKLFDHIQADLTKIAASKDLEIQRKAFMELSGNFRVILQVSKQEEVIYYQNCPMYNGGKGADWLSKDLSIKNPYYGAQMLTCGRTIETIK